MKLTLSPVKRIATRARLAELACAAALVSIGLTVALERAERPAIRAYQKAVQEYAAFEDAMALPEGPARDTIVTRNGSKLAGDLYERFTDDLAEGGRLSLQAGEYARVRDFGYGATALFLALWLARRLVCAAKREKDGPHGDLYMRYGYCAVPKVSVDGSALGDREVATLAVAIDKHEGDLGKLVATPTNGEAWAGARRVRTLLVRNPGETSGEDQGAGGGVLSGGSARQ
ncbi:hypothetical protein [Paraburkholderia youngii]|uniref:hypothetical protein n=1 Tax=Paraburkholderia youngii TaxID=2782701 RepID=UPI003D1D6306